MLEDKGTPICIPKWNIRSIVLERCWKFVHWTSLNGTFYVAQKQELVPHVRNNDPYFFVSHEIRSPLIECPFLFLNGFIIVLLRGVFYSHGKSASDRVYKLLPFFFSLLFSLIDEPKRSAANLMEYIKHRWIENERVFIELAERTPIGLTRLFNSFATWQV